MLKLTLPTDSGEESSFQVPSPRMREKNREKTDTPLYTIKKSKHKTDPLIRFVDRIMGNEYYNSLPLINDKITASSMEGHKIMRGSSDSVPFIVLCAKIEKIKNKDLVLGANRRESIKIFILTTCIYEEKTCFSLKIGAANLIYDVNDVEDRTLCRGIVEPLMKGEIITGFKVDYENETVERDQAKSIILTDQSELKSNLQCFIPPRCTLF